MLFFIQKNILRGFKSTSKILHQQHKEPLNTTFRLELIKQRVLMMLLNWRTKPTHKSLYHPLLLSSVLVSCSKNILQLFSQSPAPKRSPGSDQASFFSGKLVLFLFVLFSSSELCLQVQTPSVCARWFLERRCSIAVPDSTRKNVCPDPV